MYVWICEEVLRCVLNKIVACNIAALWMQGDMSEDGGSVWMGMEQTSPSAM